MPIGNILKAIKIGRKKEGTFEDEELINQFKSLNLTEVKMAEIAEIRATLQEVLTKLRSNENTIATLTENLNQFQTTQTIKEHEDITTTITTGEQIQLESYKSIPEFSGDKQQYRSWREQVIRRMNMIGNFKTHPKYEAALGIIRAKITKVASDILINNKTAYDIDAIVDRLDFSYADQRPLYVVEAEMTSIKQLGRSLQEYYDVINQALNMVLTKIVMTYKIEAEQKSLTAETEQKAIRTFIMGLNSAMMRNTLYGNTPKTLSKAFAIAQTIYYDNKHLQLDHESRKNEKKHQTFTQQSQQMKYNPNFNYNKQQKFVQAPGGNKPELMEVDGTARTKNAWQPQKRDFNSSRQHTQQPFKVQRINQVRDSESQLQEENYEGEGDFIPDDLISNNSHVTRGSNTASTFLGE